MQEALEAAIADLVFGPELDRDDPAAVEAWFDRHGVTGDDARALRDGELARLTVYRGLVRGTLREALEASIPRAIARLGALFDEYFDRFLAERGPRTHYVRDVTTEFLAFAAPLFERDERVAAYLIELACHEALHIEVAAAAPPKPPEAPRPPLHLDAGLVFVEASRSVRYAHAVHRLEDDVTSDRAPERAETHLFVYRSPEHEVRYLELTPLAASIVTRLARGATLREALLGATAERGVALDDAVLTGAARVIADLSDRGAILGVRLANSTHFEAHESKAAS